MRTPDLSNFKEKLPGDSSSLRKPLPQGSASKIRRLFPKWEMSERLMHNERSRWNLLWQSVAWCFHHSKKYGGSEVLVWNQGEVHKVDTSIYKGIWHIVGIAICDKTGDISSLGLRDTIRNLCPAWAVDVQHLNTCGHQNPVDHVVLIISTPAWLAWQKALEVFTTKLPIFATSPHEIYPKIGAGPVTLATNSRSECFCPIQSDKIIAWHQTNPRTNASVNKLGWSINGAPHVSIGCFKLGCHPSQ